MAHSNIYSVDANKFNKNNKTKKLPGILKSFSNLFKYIYRLTILGVPVLSI